MNSSFRLLTESHHCSGGEVEVDGSKETYQTLSDYNLPQETSFYNNFSKNEILPTTILHQEVRG